MGKVAIYGLCGSNIGIMENKTETRAYRDYVGAAKELYRLYRDHVCGAFQCPSISMTPLGILALQD